MSADDNADIQDSENDPLDYPFVPDFPVVDVPNPFENVAENVKIDAVTKRSYDVSSLSTAISGILGGLVTSYSVQDGDYDNESALVKESLASSTPRFETIDNINNTTSKPVTNSSSSILNEVNQ